MIDIQEEFEKFMKTHSPTDLVSPEAFLIIKRAMEIEGLNGRAEAILRDITKAMEGYENLTLGELVTITSALFIAAITPAFIEFEKDTNLDLFNFLKGASSGPRNN